MNLAQISEILDKNDCDVKIFQETFVGANDYYFNYFKSKGIENYNGGLLEKSKWHWGKSLSQSLKSSFWYDVKK